MDAQGRRWEAERVKRTEWQGDHWSELRERYREVGERAMWTAALGPSWPGYKEAEICRLEFFVPRPVYVPAAFTAADPENPMTAEQLADYLVRNKVAYTTWDLASCRATLDECNPHPLYPLYGDDDHGSPELDEEFLRWWRVALKGRKWPGIDRTPVHEQIKLHTGGPGFGSSDYGGGHYGSF